MKKKFQRKRKSYLTNASVRVFLFHFGNQYALVLGKEALSVDPNVQNILKQFYKEIKKIPHSIISTYTKNVGKTNLTINLAKP